VLFNSYEFIFLFLPPIFIIYFLLKDNAARSALLVISSLFFYAWWNISYLPIITISLLTNYYIGKKITTNTNQKKIYLFAGITANIILLAYFKYADFLIENINLSFNSNIEKLNLLLPLAISFFTFQQIAYLVDCYKERKTSYNLLNYSLFVTFFPQLIAGPIVHHKEMMPQFSDSTNKLINIDNICKGLFIFSIGLFKKVIIADSFSLWANTGFSNSENLTLVEAWATSLSYTFQLYFDFSGYADMAIGIALLFNIKLPTNFNSPYKARSIQDFWRRWHMTLSRFLRDYIYIPLGGKSSTLKTARNVMITFILGGIWHGAGWTFIFWGFLHGIALVTENIWKKIPLRLPSALSWLLTFNFVNIAWVFFRAENWQDAINIIHAMFNINKINLPSFLEPYLQHITYLEISFGGFLANINGNIKTLFFVFTAAIISLVFKNSTQLLISFRPTDPKTILVSVIFTIAVLSLSKSSEFLYFNF
jgi:D-alanyl-lipoteichoic acid acyltransferase DltB (MBOAT superfamily)